MGSAATEAQSKHREVEVSSMTFDDFVDAMDEFLALGFNPSEEDAAPKRKRLYEVRDAFGGDMGQLCRDYEKKKHLEDLRESLNWKGM